MNAEQQSLYKSPAVADAEQRITERIESRRKAVQMVMEANPDVKWVAEKLREAFNARLIYLQSGDVLYGKLEIGTPVGLVQIREKPRKHLAKLK